MYCWVEGVETARIALWHRKSYFDTLLKSTGLNPQGCSVTRNGWAVWRWLRRKTVRSSFAGSALIAGLLAVSALGPNPAAAQNNAPASKQPVCCATNDELQKYYADLPELKKATPRAPDGHPDLSGFWDNPFAGVTKKSDDGSVGFYLGGKRDPSKPVMKYPPPSEPSYKPEYAAKVKAILDTQVGPTTALDPQMDCKPLGVPRASMVPLQIVQNSKAVVLLYESNFIGQTFRMIYTDGRSHPKDLDSSFLGDSVGHWEGDTLVVDVTGLNDETWLGGAQGHTEAAAFGETGSHQIVEREALIHSDQEHVIERYTRKGDMLLYEATVEDPQAFTKPWVLTPRHFMIGVPPDDRLFESFCDNHDKDHFVAPSKDDSSAGKSF